LKYYCEIKQLNIDDRISMNVFAMNYSS